eukprot:3637306-Rhodomonas_salina.1
MNSSTAPINSSSCAVNGSTAQRRQASPTSNVHRNEGTAPETTGTSSDMDNDSPGNGSVAAACCHLWDSPYVAALSTKTVADLRDIRDRRREHLVAAYAMSVPDIA